MAVTMNRGSFQRTLTEVINTTVGLNYDVWDQEWPNFFSQHTTERAEIRDVVMAPLGVAVVKPEGESIKYDSGGELWNSQYVVVTAALGFRLTEEAVEDNQYVDLAKAFGKSLGQSIPVLKDVMGAGVLNNAFDTSGTYNGGDATNLIATNHPLANASATFANGWSTNPDLSEESLEDAYVLIDGFVNDRGIPSMAQGDKIIIPRQSRFILQRIIGNSMRPNTANRDINAMEQLGVLPEKGFVSHYLTNTNSWYITVKGADITDEGLKYFQRRPLKKGEEPEFSTGDYRYKASERFAFGWTNPRGIVGSKG